MTNITASRARSPYSITVICTIHPDSTADQCEVRAMGDSGVTKASNVNIYIQLYTYVHTYSICLLILRARLVVFLFVLSKYMYVPLGVKTTDSLYSTTQM